MIFNQTADDRKVRVFSLSRDFVNQYKGRQPKWGPLGQFTFMRTYSRELPEGGTEEYWQVCRRVVEGCFNIQKIHCRQMGLPWNEQKAQGSAQDMFERMWLFKFLPPGRGLWTMGTDLVYQRGSGCLLNCAFTSTENIAEDLAAPFCFLMDMSMLGVGVGGDTRGAGKVRIQVPRISEEPYVVEDSREGWVDLVRTILNSFAGKGYYPQVIDYSRVRGRGEPIKTFGGVASGPRPLQELVEGITRILLPGDASAHFEILSGEEDKGKLGAVRVSIQDSGENSPQRISMSQIVDVFNYIGRCVVAGGVRRSSEILFGDPDDQEFLRLKQDKEALRDRRWASNNSVFGHVGMDYTDVAESLAINGEPGIFWLDNARRFARMNGIEDDSDWRVMGSNPCFAGETLIAVADGRGAVPIQQLADEGKDVPVYSVDDTGEVEIQMARNPRLTRERAPLVEIVLDDDTSLRVTPDHEIRLLDGSHCQAVDLCPGDSLPRLTKDKIFEPRLYERQSATTDLKCVWIDERPYALKKCEVCGQEFTVSWCRREQAYCSRSCGALSIQSRQDGQRIVFSNPQRQTLHLQIQHYKDLEQELGRQPFRKEWESRCQEAGVSRRFWTRGTPYALTGFNHLKQVAADYNHRVVKVQTLDIEEPVYNLTVDQNHTVGIVTKFDPTTKECAGIFTPQCGEQPLESNEGCNLVETFPAHHDSYDDFQATLKKAYLYAKTVTLVPTHDLRANAVMTRNRRIGCSMSGIIQAMVRHGRREFLNWCDQGYAYIQQVDRIYSDWLGVPLSRRTTTVKPSGSVSLLAHSFPGIHYPHSKYYIRNIRVANTSPLVEAARRAGHPVEPDTYASDTSVISFPVREKMFTKGKSEVSIWEQFCNAADMQKHWSDNALSCLTGDARVRTSIGIIPMRGLSQEMGVADMPGIYRYRGPLQVLTAGNEWAPVSALIINAPKPTLRVRLEGLQELRGTPDHEIQVIGPDLDLIWKPLSDIKVGDHVVEVINQKTYPSSTQIVRRKLEKYSYPGRSDADRVRIPTRMTLELAEFLGYMVSDGWVQNSTGKVFGLSQKANNVVEHYTELVDNLFGLNTTAHIDKRTEGDIPLCQLSVHSTKVVHWLRWLGLYDERNLKRVPWPVLMAGPRAIKSFLRGVTLDGHLCQATGRTVVMTTNSTSLADELCLLLKQVGFQPIKVKTQNDKHEMVSPTNGKVYACRPAWAVSISASQTARFMRMIGFAEEDKEESYRKYGNQTRRHIFGCVPDFGLRKQMRALSHQCSSHFLKSHWHSRGQHEGKRVSRETLLQMRDLGTAIPHQLLRSDITFRQVVSVESGDPEVTYDITVEGAHSYTANGFASHNCTISFRPEEKRDIISCLEAFEDQLKGVSMMPLADSDHGYAQPPYQAISREEYEALASRISPIDFENARHEVDDKFCSGDKCQIPLT